MKGTTHIAGGAVAGLAFAATQDLTATVTITVTACAMVGALIPDIDVCTSRAGRVMPTTSFLIQLFIGHRTLFHAPLLYAALYATVARFLPQSILLAQAVMIGVASHILLDLLNPAGVPLLWPVPKRFHIAGFRSGGVFDRVIGIAFLVCAGIMAAARFGVSVFR